VKLKASITYALILALIIGFRAEIYAQNAFPRIEPDAKALNYYRLGTQGYSWSDLAEIALWASGDASLSGMAKIKTVVSSLNSAITPNLSDKEKADFILNYMHNNILKSYYLYQTRLDTIFTNGRFNCVSSAVLYVILCKSAGINTSGVMTKDHAFAIVHINGQNFDVETTNPYGFDPGNRKEFHDSSGKTTGFAYVPPQNYRDRQTISQIELVSLIFSNRIGDFERSGNFAAAVPLAVDRTALLLGNSYTKTSDKLVSDFLFADPRKELIDRLINYGAALLRSNKEDDGIRWAVLASSLYPDPSRWQEFSLAAINNKLSKLIKDKNIQDARKFLESQKSLLSQTDYNQFDSLIFDADLLNKTNSFKTAAEGNDILSAIDQARTSGKIPEKRAAELLNYTIQKIASYLCAPPDKDWRAAIRYLEGAIAKYGTNRELDQAIRTYKANLVADYHNRFAAEWNKKNFTEAERILKEGLAEFPNDKQLLADKQNIDKQPR